jgi:hypothetical protein
MVKESEYGANIVYIMYANRKKNLLNLFQEWGEGRMKENGIYVEGCIQVYLIYCKNFCKCHNVAPPSTTIK